MLKKTILWTGRIGLLILGACWFYDAVFVLIDSREVDRHGYLFLGSLLVLGQGLATVGIALVSISYRWVRLAGALALLFAALLFLFFGAAVYFP